MDKLQRLHQETEKELERMKEKHDKEWEEVKIEAHEALEGAKTAREVKKIDQDYKRKMDLLSKRQTEDYVELQREFVKKLTSL